METPGFLIKRSLVLFYGSAASVILLIADYFAGPFIQFPVSYLLPVAFVSWYHGRRMGLAFAVLLPMFRFYFNVALWSVPWTILEASINAVIRMVVLCSFAVIIDRAALQTRAMKKEVSLLEGLLPICGHCGRIRNESEQWQELETYIQQRSGATFSHVFCPDCMKEYWGDVEVGTK
jgi:K+-sensing histidine kinase KdpD